MSARVTRTTTRTVDLPPDLGVTVERSFRMGGVFRAERAVEELTERANGVGGGYLVTLAGPMQTSAGKDHAKNRASVQYGSWNRDHPLDTIPEAVRPFLVGPDALRGPIGDETT